MVTFTKRFSNVYAFAYANSYTCANSYVCCDAYTYPKPDSYYNADTDTYCHIKSNSFN